MKILQIILLGLIASQASAHVSSSSAEYHIIEHLVIGCVIAAPLVYFIVKRFMRSH